MLRCYLENIKKFNRVTAVVTVSASGGDVNMVFALAKEIASTVGITSNVDGSNMVLTNVKKGAKCICIKSYVDKPNS